MLDQKTITIIQSLAPALAERGLDVTLRMYDLLFTEHPEITSIFNMANQSSQKQPLALANAVYAYAANIDKLEALTPTISLIANKHASLGVKPAHYDAVGVCLRQALLDVFNLDNAALSAWDKAYKFLANIFIDEEEMLYRQSSEQNGGWDDYRPFDIINKVPESTTITSFYLRPTDGKALAAFKPGQYVAIKVTDTKGHQSTRNYSLSDAPDKEYYRLTVKRENSSNVDNLVPDGLVSSYLHDHCDVGTRVELRTPMGNFFLKPKDNKPVVLLSGGVGLTPMVSMLETIALQHSGKETYFIHAAINSETHAMKSRIADLANKHPNIHQFTCYSEPTPSDVIKNNYDKTGFVNANWLQSLLSQLDCDYYFCGPKPFMQTISKILRSWDIPADQINYEFFGPSSELE